MMRINEQYLRGFITALLYEFDQHTPFLHEIDAPKIEITLSKVEEKQVADVNIHFSIPGLDKQFISKIIARENNSEVQMIVFTNMAIEEICATIKKVTKA